MTDFMCEPVDLDEWIKEIKEEDSREQPRSFSDRVPEVKAASRFHAPMACTWHWARSTSPLFVCVAAVPDQQALYLECLR